MAFSCFSTAFQYPSRKTRKKVLTRYKNQFFYSAKFWLILFIKKGLSCHNFSQAMKGFAKPHENKCFLVRRLNLREKNRIFFFHVNRQVGIFDGAFYFFYIFLLVDLSMTTNIGSPQVIYLHFLYGEYRFEKKTKSVDFFGIPII